MRLPAPPRPQPLPDLPPHLQLRPHFTRTLQGWNPLDALRLLYWVFFKPQFLRDYVEYLAPGAGEARGREAWNLLRQQPALRNFVLHALLLEILVPFGLAWLLQQAGLSVYRSGVAFGVALGVAFSVAGGVVFGMAFGVAFSVAGGVAGGVALGVAGGVAFSVAGDEAVVMAFVMAFGVALGVVFGMAFGVAFGVAGGVALGVAFGVAFGMTFGVVVGVMLGVAVGAMFGVAVGMTFGVAGGLAGSVVGGLAGSVVGGVAVGVAVGVVVSRAPLYPLSALLGVRRDGLAWLPLPALRRQLRNAWRQDPALGVAWSREVLAYSLQFIPIVAAANDWLTEQPAQSHRFARLALQAGQPDLLRYASRSLGAMLWREFKRGLLILPRRWRPIPPPPYRQDTPARAVCGAYARVLDRLEPTEDTMSAPRAPNDATQGLPPASERAALTSALLQAARVFASFPDFPHAAESAWAYRLLGRLLAADDLPGVRACAGEKSPVALEAALRPELVYALQVLLQAAEEAGSVLRATSDLLRQQAALRATESLRDLGKYVRQTCFEPEKTILSWVIERWSALFITVGGQLGRRGVLNVIPNNFVVGPPVRAALGQPFVGRQAEYEQILRLWSNETSKQPILIWGQRRIGKTSLLLNLQANLGEHYLPVYVTLETAGAVSSLAGFFYNLGRTLSMELKNQGLEVAAPPLEAFKSEPFARFDAFLDELSALIPAGKWLVLMLDEFEKIESKVTESVFPPDLIGYLRGLMQVRPSFGIILAGSHQLEEMRRDFWNPFMGSTHVLHLGYLSEAEAERLVTNPWPDFPLNYEPQAVKRILRECGGQPMLIQAVGAQVLEIINARLRETPQEAPLATEQDVETALERVLESNANDYFPALLKSLSPGARELLREVARHQAGGRRWVTVNKPYPEKVVNELLQRDLLERAPQKGFRVRIELLRKWLRRQE